VSHHHRPVLVRPGVRRCNGGVSELNVGFNAAHSSNRGICSMGCVVGSMFEVAREARPGFYEITEGQSDSVQCRIKALLPSRNRIRRVRLPSISHSATTNLPLSKDPLENWGSD
jgi:hypothetical protein